MNTNLFISILCVSSFAWAGGTVEGVVTLKGDAPAGTPRPVTQDKEKCGIGDSVPDDSLVVDKTTKGIAHAVVMLEPAAGGAKTAAEAPQTIVFDQKHCLFTQHVLVVPEKSEVEFKNSDTVAHNVNLKAIKNKGFNKSIAGNESTKWTAEREEKIPIECSVHPWMKGWLVVTDAPYYAVTDAQGNFKIENVPPGAYKVKVWQERITSKKNWEGSAEVTVKEGETARLEFKGTLAK